MNNKAEIAANWLRAELENPHVKPTDNFLDVGGDSLMAMNLAAHVLSEMGLKLNMVALFQRSIAEAVAASEAEAPSAA